jgi:hypothetical protein
VSTDTASEERGECVREGQNEKGSGRRKGGEGVRGRRERERERERERRIRSAENTNLRGSQGRVQALRPTIHPHIDAINDAVAL